MTVVGNKMDARDIVHAVPVWRKQGAMTVVLLVRVLPAVLRFPCLERRAEVLQADFLVFLRAIDLQHVVQVGRGLHPYYQVATLLLVAAVDRSAWGGSI